MTDLDNKKTDLASNIQEKLCKLYDNVQQIDSELLEQVLLDSKQTAQDLSEKAYQEGQNITKTLRQDIYSLAIYVQKTGKLLLDWVKLDLQYIEEPVLQMLYKIADRTQLENDQRDLDALRNMQYQTGDIVLIGTFMCSKCKEHFELYHISELPKCSNCNNDSFTRAV